MSEESTESFESTVPLSDDANQLGIWDVQIFGYGKYVCLDQNECMNYLV